MVVGLFETVRRSVELVVRAVGQSDQRAAQDALLLKDEIRDFADRLFERHAKRLHIDDPKYVQRVRLMATFIEQLRHMYTLTKRVAKTQLPPALAQHEA
jgi:Na+/phosphate symporter